MSKRVNNHRGKKPPSNPVPWWRRLRNRRIRDARRKAIIAERRRIRDAKAQTWHGLGGNNG